MIDYTDDFESAWQAYPKRNNKKVGKKPAFMHWKKMTVAERGAAKADIDKRTRMNLWGKYIKDMERYLKQAGWDDEVDMPNQTVTSHIPHAKTDFKPRERWDKVSNLIYLRYVMAAKGLPDSDTALNIKCKTVREHKGMLDEEAELSGSKEAVMILANLLLDQWDEAYGLHLKGSLIGSRA